MTKKGGDFISDAVQTVPGGRRLKHVCMRLNDDRMWYLAIGECGPFWMTLIANRLNGGVHTQSLVHAVPKAEYVYADDVDEMDSIL